MFCILTDQLAQIKEITHAKVLCSVLKDDYGDISYQARLFERQHRDRLVVMKNMRFREIKKKFCVFFNLVIHKFINQIVLSKYIDR